MTTGQAHETWVVLFHPIAFDDTLDQALDENMYKGVSLTEALSILMRKPTQR